MSSHILQTVAYLAHCHKDLASFLFPKLAKLVNKNLCKVAGHNQQVEDEVLAVRGLSNSQANVASNDVIPSRHSQAKDEVPAVTKDELTHLMTLITFLTKPFGSFSLTLSGKNFYF